MKVDKVYDVIILGTGIGGTMLAAILAKKGLSMLMIDAGSHPRFAIGESTTPDTSIRYKMLSLKYEVPEIAFLSTFYKLRDHVSPASGVKRAVSFLYHREGQEQNPCESHQYPTLAPPMGPDCHFFRQDTDAFMLSVALQYGAEVRQQLQVSDISFTDDQVTLIGEKGEKFRTRYLVDGAGFRSPLAKKFNLRLDPNEMSTNTRSIFTHMVGVKLYEEIGASPKKHGLKYPLSQGTLHHVFEGGWFWIIPFNNHLDSVNPLCSVGLVLNRDFHMETGMDPEDEFFQFVRKFPNISKQFEGAKAIRNWVSTGRINYHSKNINGKRYTLLPHAAGFVDPLFSSGLNVTAGAIDLLAAAIIRAFENDDFKVENFEQVNEFFQYNFKIYDEMVGNALIAFRKYELWDAWYRVWVIGLLVSTALNANQFLKYMETKDAKVLKYSEGEPYNGALGSKFPEFRQLYDSAVAEIDEVKEGIKAPKIAAKNIVRLFETMNFTPTFWRWHDVRVRSTPTFTLWGMTKMYFWYLLRAPKHIRKLMMGWNPLTAYGLVFNSILESYNHSRKRRKRYVRDVFKSWNQDWKPASGREHFKI